MFMPAGNTAQSNLSRPFILGVLLLLLFLSTQSEWAANQRRHNQKLIQVGQDVGETARKRQVKDDILLELSVLNENMEKENKRLLTVALELNRALRNCGMAENATAIMSQLDVPYLSSPGEDNDDNNNKKNNNNNSDQNSTTNSTSLSAQNSTSNNSSEEEQEGEKQGQRKRNRSQMSRMLKIMQ
eukprot:TRINITY_DN7134_c0_g4_i2.p2 TRINITY_DN7134_c0_g4~~TRINITY_DN7134_c0_g4_i2.p2  ORF type:complete len:185 (+),score=26.06 TRINITY_DN7134_c0_g4_i2:1234-1788(+)